MLNAAAMLIGSCLAAPADERLTSEQLGLKAGLSASLCARRVRLLEAAGVIKGYVAVIDQSKVDLPIRVFVSVKLERQREEELGRFAIAVSKWPEVADSFLMAGQRYYLLCIVAKD